MYTQSCRCYRCVGRFMFNLLLCKYFCCSNKLLFNTVQIIMTIIRCIFSFLFIGGELTTWSANNCLQISVLLQTIFSSCVIETTLLCEYGGSVPRAGRGWLYIFRSSKERWSNDKTIIEHGYRKISWFVSVSQFNYLPQSSASANNCCARHWQTHYILLNLIK